MNKCVCVTLQLWLEHGPLQPVFCHQPNVQRSMSAENLQRQNEHHRSHGEEGTPLPRHSPTPPVLFTVWKLPAMTRSRPVPSLHLSSINWIKRSEASNLCSIDWAELWPLHRFQIICFHLSPLFHSIPFQLRLTVSLKCVLIAPASPCQGNETLAAKVHMWAANFPTSPCILLPVFRRLVIYCQWLWKDLKCFNVVLNGIYSLLCVSVCFVQWIRRPDPSSIYSP